MMNSYDILNGQIDSTQKIYCLRHAQTALDATHRSDGWLDLPLSDKGRQQLVETLVNYLKYVPITCIYASSLLRTEETANIVQSGLVSKPEIEITDNLITWNLGSLAGDEKQARRNIVRDLIANPEESAPDGESYNDFTDRFDEFVTKMESEAQDEGPLLLVVSGSCCRRLGELLFHDRAALDMDECGLFVMYKNGDKWTADVLTGLKDEDQENSYDS
jgi:broad specificity phosphatase PhoE